MEFNIFNKFHQILTERWNQSFHLCKHNLKHVVPLQYLFLIFYKDRDIPMS